MYEDVRNKIEASRKGQAHSIRLSGRWVGLTGPMLFNVLMPIWRSRVQNVTDVVNPERISGLRAFSADGDAAFVYGLQWFGAIPGDAMESAFEMLFTDGTLIETGAVDSCTETELEIKVWSQKRPDQPLINEIESALRSLARD